MGYEVEDIVRGILGLVVVALIISFVYGVIPGLYNTTGTKSICSLEEPPALELESEDIVDSIVINNSGNNVNVTVTRESFDNSQKSTTWGKQIRYTIQ